MKNFLLLSAIYLFSPQISTAEDAADLRRALGARMPEAAIGEIRKLPYVDLYEIQVNGGNVFYADSSGEVALFGNLVNLQARASLSEQRKHGQMAAYSSARARRKSLPNAGGRS